MSAPPTCSAVSADAATPAAASSVQVIISTSIAGPSEPFNEFATNEPPSSQRTTPSTMGLSTSQADYAFTLGADYVDYLINIQHNCVQQTDNSTFLPHFGFS